MSQTASVAQISRAIRRASSSSAPTVKLAEVRRSEKIVLNPLLEAAASFALRDVDKVVHEQFAVAPRFRANHDRVAEADATGVRSDDPSAPGGLSQFAVLRQRDAVDDQNPDALTILDAGPARISEVLRTEGNAVGENEFFLGFGPLISKRQKLLECFLVDHVGEGFGDQR